MGSALGDRGTGEGQSEEECEGCWRAQNTGTFLSFLP